MSELRAPVFAVASITLLASVGLVVRQAEAGEPAVAVAAVVDASRSDELMRRTGSSAVALTFDDGPDPVVTPKLLDVLKKQKIKATFCVVGHRARDNPAIIQRMVAEGHTLCNHSWQHLENLGKLDAKKIRTDLAATSKWIRRAVPGVPIEYFRAPYGNFTPRLNKIARGMGMKLLSWNVDDQSWASKKHGKGAKLVAHMTKLVKKHTRKGSIVLSHEMAKPWTVTAYRSLLPWLKKRFKLIPLPVTKPVPTTPVPKPSSSEPAKPTASVTTPAT
jgi:peptidoglycan/xylan/chitin deacetylase (PgdA/CDA1 family)